MSRLTLIHGESVVAASRLSGVANSLGSDVFEWLCIATIVRCLAANGATRREAESVEDAVTISAPRARAVSNPRSISSSEKPSLKLRL